MEIKKETTQQRFCRKSRNTWIKSLGFCRKTDLLARAKLKKDELKNRKKSFGVTYMDLLERGATAEEIDRCVQAGRLDLEVINQDLTKLRAAIGRVDDKTKSKMRSNPHLSVKYNAEEHDEFVAVATPIHASALYNVNEHRPVATPIYASAPLEPTGPY